MGILPRQESQLTYRGHNSHKRQPRARGSVVLIAMVALVVMGILIMALHHAVSSRYGQVHHAYYNEKAMALIEGLNSIARGEAQKELEEIIKAAGEWHDIDGVLNTATGLRLVDANDAQPTVSVKARILKANNLKYYAQAEPYQTIKEDISKDAEGIFKNGNEVEGIVEIQVDLEIGGFEGVRFKVPKKTITTQYEFKRIRRVPPFFRHFSLYVKKAITQKEDPDRYAASGNFNFARVPMTGNSAGGCGVLFVKSGSSLSPMQLPKVDEGPATEEAKKQNPFATDVGYVYLGGEDDNDAYFNLTAGNDNEPYSETFQLYRGTTTDFYKVWDVDFTNFIEKARAEVPGGKSTAAEGQADKEGWVRAAWGWLKDKVKAFMNWLKKAVKALAELDAIEYTGKSEKSANLPLYYIVRKDYGYALEWGKNASYRRFGFSGGDEGDSGQTIYCNALHLYGTKNFDGSEKMCPTLVMGNVYRRYLSLAGYKQRRASENPSAKRKFEVQAGPIEYFKTYKSLMKRGQDPTAKEPEKAPIWVWDARVDWNRGSKKVTGTYLPISGPGLFGRIMPGLARLWEDEKGLAAKLFNYSICPPDELSTSAKPSESAETITREGGDFEEDVKGGISPLFLGLQRGRFFEKPTAYKRGRIYKDTSPYFEELSRCFAYACYGTMKKINEGRGQEEGLEDPDLKKLVELAAQRWQDVISNGATGGLDVKQIKFPDDIVEPESKNKAKFWEHSEKSAANDPAANIYPFSLPDPWARSPKVTPNFQEKFEISFQGDREELFKRYFYHIMTNPAMVQPYNNGMRFIFKPLRDIFAKSGDERMKELSDNIIPELRDGISFIVDGKNEYLKRKKKDRFNQPINDEILKKIHAKRQGDAYLQKGYFFMDDYGQKMQTPADADLTDVFRGRRHFWKMGWEDFKKRFITVTPLGQTIRLNTIVALTEDLIIDQKTQVIGGGAILLGSGDANGPVKIDGTAEFKANLRCNAPLFIVASDIKLGGDLQYLDASLIALNDIRFGGMERVWIKGNVCVEGWNFRSSVCRGGGRYLIDFNNGLKSDTSYIQNIEPRIHRFHIQGAGR